MMTPNLRKHKWAISAVLTAVVLAVGLFQLLIFSHMYPQDIVHEGSNLSVRGTVISVETNRKSDGFGLTSYHIFRLYIHVNITEIVWAKDGLTRWNTVSYANNTVNGGRSIIVGYDNLDNPQLAVGQNVECKGYYVPVTDTPYSFKITVSQSINGSFLKPQA